MPYVTTETQLIYFSHIPKTGGSSIEDWMESAFDGIQMLDRDWTRGWKRGGWSSGRPPHSPQHTIWEIAEPHLPRPADHVFAVVRHPVTRLESEFRFQSHHLRKRQRITRLGFSRWLRIMFCASRIVPSFLDNHFRLQSDFVPEHARMFHFEDGLDRVTDWLSETFPDQEASIPLPGPQSKRTRQDLGASDADLALIADWFTRDFDRFGYLAPPRGTYRIGAQDRWLGVLVAALYRIGRF